MLIRELLDKFGLSLNLPNIILDIEIEEGEYESYDIEEDEWDIVYYFRDGPHELQICETDDIPIWYLFFPAPDAAPGGWGCDKNGAPIDI